jgi:rhodanese-related sulfurtransferase
MFDNKARRIFCELILCLMPLNPLLAQEVNISQSISNIKTVHNGKVINIHRIQDQRNMLTGGYTKTSRKCPPFCIQPMLVAPGVITVGELEVLDFIKNKVNKGRGVIIDARTPSWFNKATIPGSINIPFYTFNKDSDTLIKLSSLAKLGVTQNIAKKKRTFVDYFVQLIKDERTENEGHLDFSKAKSILLWCNGMWCGQSPRAIKGLLSLGYPADKIYYYRGGMQAWQSLGLSIIENKENIN